MTDSASPERWPHAEAISAAASAIAGSPVEAHADVVHTLIGELWAWLVADARPAVRTASVNTARRALVDSLDALGGVDPPGALRMAAEAGEAVSVAVSVAADQLAAEYHR